MPDTQTDTLTRGRARGQRMKRYERRETKRAFLQRYAVHPSASAACRAVGISRSALYSWLHNDSLFLGKYDALTCLHFDGRYKYMSEAELKDYRRSRKAGARLYRYYTGQEYERPEPRYHTATLDYTGLRK